MRIVNRTVLILSLVSLFADIASEMLYPIVPVYLKEIGFSIILIGVLEGFAEFTAGISKGYFGKLSDEKGVRLPFIKWGYLLSAISKPMMAVFIQPLGIFFARTTDRLGKGLRTAARDALLSHQATKETKATVFGFHRSLDTIGAAIGPIITLIFLHYFPKQYASIFFLAFIPGIIAVLFLFLLKEKKQSVATLGKGNFFSFLKYWNIASPQFKRIVCGMILFALINSSDIFLLLLTKEITGSDSITIVAYVFYNLVFASVSYPMGIIADKYGIKKTFIFGLLLFVIVYGGFAFNPSIATIFILFFIYGLYAAATEGVAKAWITNSAHHNNTATAIGFFTTCQSVSALFASTIAGIIWSQWGSQFVFLISAIVALIIVVYFLLMKE